MKALLVMPIVIPLVAGALGLVAWRSRAAQRALAACGAAALLATAGALLWMVDRHGVLAVQVGDWPAPFGITLVADLFAAIMVFIAAVLGACVIFYSFWAMDKGRESFGYYPLTLVLLMGVNGAFLTGDIFNLYVWFEVMLMASFVLLALGGERPQLEGAIKYVTLNLVSSALFLAATGILYGVAGTLNMADLAGKLGDNIAPRLTTTLSMLYLAAFGIKAGLFPLFFWLPASYHTPPPAVSAIFAGLLTKVGVYAIIRVFTLIFTLETALTHGVILILAGFTMVTGVLGAAAQNDFRRILAFHIVSQIGYIIMGLGLYSRMALAGAIFFIVHNIIAKSNLFLVSGVVHRLRGTGDLKKLGGLYEEQPALAICFMISAMALAGIPPLSGFFGKLVLVIAGIQARAYIIVAVSLLVSLLTLFSMTKIWAGVFWKPASEDPDVLPPSDAIHAIRRMMIPVAFLAGLNVLFGVGFEPCYALALRAADQLLDKQAYIAAVLGT